MARGDWQWRLMGAVLVGMAAGFGAAWVLGQGASSIEAAIVGGFTAAAGSRGGLRTSVPVAALVGVLVVLSSSLGAATTGYPWAASLAMAAIAFLTSVMTASAPVGLLIGMVVSYSYFLTTSVGLLARDAVGHDLGRIGLLGAIGLAAGLVVVTLRAGIEQLIGTASTRRPRPHPARPARPCCRPSSRPCAPSTPMPATACAARSPSVSPCSSCRSRRPMAPSGSSSPCSSSCSRTDARRCRRRSCGSPGP